MESTYTVHGDETWNGLPPTPPPARTGGQADLRGVNPAWVGGDRRSLARVPSWPNHSTPGETGNFSRSSMFHSRDIGQEVADSILWSEKPEYRRLPGEAGRLQSPG